MTPAPLLSKLRLILDSLDLYRQTQLEYKNHPYKDMKDLENWDLYQCYVQIWHRTEVLNNMVGNLYPAIVQDEITRIELRKNELKQMARNTKSGTITT